MNDEALRVNHIVRDNAPHFPHKKDCGELASGFLAVLPPDQPVGAKGSANGQLVERLIAQASPALKHCNRGLLDACRNLTFGNPTNK